MIKQSPIGVRLSPEEREALEAAASAEDRPVSSMVRKIAVDWLRREGWLKVKK